MIHNKPIAVDHSKAEATLQVIPNSSLLHCCKTAWNGMYLEYHYAPPHETPEHYPTQHVIGIQTEGTVQTERRLDGQFRRERIVSGDICIVPAYTRHWVYSEAEQGLILLSLDPTFLVRRLQESIDLEHIEILPHFAQNDPLIHHIGLSLKNAVQNDPIGSQFYAESLSVALAAHLVRYYATVHHAQLPISSLPEARIRKAIDYINDHLTDNLSLEIIATTIGMSQYHFCRVFKQATGLTPWQYIVLRRIEVAKRLLAAPQLSIVEISQQLGFSTQGQFTNFFKKQTGVTPTQYRSRL